MSLVEKNYEFPVSIGNVTKAITALRTYGLTQKVAEEVISNESITAIYDHGMIPKEALSPYLIEIFGEQHINDAISFTYLFMDDFDIDWEHFKMILNTLLRVYRAEDIIVTPEKIRFFINAIENKTKFKLLSKAIDSDVISKEALFSETLYELDEEDIKDMATDPLDKENPEELEEDNYDE